MPKLQKQSAWKRKGKEYSKWVITLPGSEVEKAGFHEGEELVAIAMHPKTILLVPRHMENPPIKKKMSKKEKAYRDAFLEYQREVMQK
jgi:3-deoxy-D-manno-octulosonic-acid transferase